MRKVIMSILCATVCGLSTTAVAWEMKRCGQRSSNAEQSISYNCVGLSLQIKVIHYTVGDHYALWIRDDRKPNSKLEREKYGICKGKQWLEVEREVKKIISAKYSDRI